MDNAEVLCVNRTFEASRSTSVTIASVRQLASVLVAAMGLYGLFGCEVDRPVGAYTPREHNVVVDASADSDEDIYGDAATLPSFDDDDEADDDDQGDDVTPERDAGPGAADGGMRPTEPPDNPLVGDYWMRADVSSTTTATSGATSIETKTDTRVYSLVRVDYQGERLKFADFQCALRIDQQCLRGCTTVSTMLADPARSGRAFVPSFRDLTVTDDRWSASRVPYALGWRGDFNRDPNLKLPATDSDPLVIDPDGGEDGINISITIKVPVLPARTCNLRVAQKIDVSYAGMLTSGKLETGMMTEMGSDQVVFANSCGGDTGGDDETSMAPVRVIPARKPIDLKANPWPCPSLSEFESAFGG